MIKVQISIGLTLDLDPLYCSAQLTFAVLERVDNSSTLHLVQMYHLSPNVPCLAPLGSESLQW